MTTGFVAILAAVVVLLPAVFGFGRSSTYAWIGFIGVIAGGAVLVLTPTPVGFDPNGASQRWLLSAAIGQEISAALLAAGVAGLLGAFFAGHAEPIEHTEQSHL
jgi:hypothetical protein